MSDFVPGIKVEISVGIEDPEALGGAVADLDSDAQARFLVGLANEFLSFDDPGAFWHMQIRYVTEELKEFDAGDRQAVSRFVEVLAAHVGEVSR